MPSPREESAPPWPLIGRREYVDFPDWGLRRVRAKVDTGARTSALDVAGCELVETPGGQVARLRLALGRRPKGHVREIEASVVRTVTVRNPGGGLECRPVVETTVRLGSALRRLQLTLTRRAGLRCPMLLGRRALAGAFLVDVSRKDLLRR
jgi:hypothetical protein